MTAVMFSVPGTPVGKGRPRVGKIGGNARMFTPAKTAAYEGLIAHAASVAMGAAVPIEQACSVEMLIACPVPASWSKKKQAQALAGEILPTTKPDTDNVVKAIFDGMNGVVWRDDVQAVDLRVRKRYAEAPRVVVRVVVIAPTAAQASLA